MTKMTATMVIAIAIINKNSGTFANEKQLHNWIPQLFQELVDENVKLKLYTAKESCLNDNIFVYLKDNTLAYLKNSDNSTLPPQGLSLANEQGY